VESTSDREHIICLNTTQRGGGGIKGPCVAADDNLEQITEILLVLLILVLQHTHAHTIANKLKTSNIRRARQSEGEGEHRGLV